MAVIKEVKLKPKVKEDILPINGGLKWAVVYQDKKVVALFDCEYGASTFINKVTSYSEELTVREVAD